MQAFHHACWPLQIRETEHSTQKSTNGTWQPEEKLVRYTFATADWELQDSSSTVVAVHEAAKADDLHMATVGPALQLLRRRVVNCMTLVHTTPLSQTLFASVLLTTSRTYIA